MVSESKIWVTGVLVAARGSLLLGAVSKQNKEIYVCILTCGYVHCTYLCIRVYSFICIHSYVYTLWTWVHTDVSLSNPLPCGSFMPSPFDCNLLLQQLETWLPPSALYLLTCLILIVQFQGICILVPQFLTCREQFYLLEHSAHVQAPLPFSLVDSIPPQRHEGQHRGPPPPSGRLYHAFVHCRFFCHSLHSSLGASDLLR